MWPEYSAATRKAVNDLLKQGGSLSAYRANPKFPSWTGPTEGSYAWKLEREIERKFKVKHAIAVNSGTAGLHAALWSLQLPRGSEVVTSPYTFSATASAIVLSGLVPVFADVDPSTFCITKETISEVITRRTKAILPVSIFGGLCHAGEIGAHFGLPVVEDACQAVGANEGGRYSGTTATAGAYSFNGGKNIPAGEAGCAVTNDGRLAEKMRLLANHGENFFQKEVGFNYRPNEVTAAIAYHGLLELEERNQGRIDLAKALYNELQDMADPWEETEWELDIDDPQWPLDGSHVFYVAPFTIAKDREQFIDRMAKRNIPVGAGYIQPTLQHYKAFKKYARGPLPVVEELSKKTLCILSTLTPDKPLSYAAEVAKAMRESLE